MRCNAERLAPPVSVQTQASGRTVLQGGVPLGTKIWASKVDIESKRTAHIREDSPAKRLQRSQASARKHRPQRNDSMAPATSTKLSFAVALLVALLSPASAFTATPALAHLGARPATCAGCQPRAPAPPRPRAPAPLRGPAGPSGLCLCIAWHSSTGSFPACSATGLPPRHRRNSRGAHLGRQRAGCCALCAVFRSSTVRFKRRHGALALS